MKIHCIGGGPGGLYAAILLKKLDPKNEVTVWERNAPDDTFGWGVVFSDRTQDHLRNADAESHEAITKTFATWDDIDVHYQGEVHRSTGHGFCGLSRQTMLVLLQDRAQALGVKINFETEVTDVDDFRDCDLLVAADGINSAIRTKYAANFGPDLDWRPNRFTWLGTKQQFEAFTFSFRENDAGLFMVHAYQFEPGTSTFIVETDADSFANSGLAVDDEAATIAYCEKLFAEELGGHALMANRSHWIQFRTVRNRTWHHENMVLIGDAAHTAHYSIGSGTKLAMEDAIALAGSFRGHDTVAAALPAYEAARRPNSDSIQRAAQSSLEWFESTRRYMGMPPKRFVFSLLTRSMRITHDNLALRDPAYVEDADRWLNRDLGIEGADDLSKPPVPPMFTPFTLGGVQLKNRVVVSPMCQYSADDGVPNEWHMVHLGSRAIGGAALVFTEMTDVSAEGRITPGCAGIYTDEQEAAWKRIVDFVHDQSTALIGMQLGHAGRKGATKRLWEGYDVPVSEGAWPLIAASPIPWAPESAVPSEMDRASMVRVRDEYVAAAKRALRAGFDVLEVHMAHGYLLSGFISPLSNQRGDEYGGGLEGRARFPLEVLDAVREVWADKPLSVRISATDWAPDGFTGDDAVALATMLKDHGVDLVDVSTGQTSTEAKPAYGRLYQTPFADRIRNEVDIATMAVGTVSTYDDINTIVLAGRADLVALARAHLADPYFTMHAAREQGFDGHEWPVQYESAKRLRFLVK